MFCERFLETKNRQFKLLWPQEDLEKESSDEKTHMHKQLDIFIGWLFLLQIAHRHQQH